MKHKLADIDKNILLWESLCEQYPQCDEYREILAKLRHERVALVSEIGHKRMVMRKRNRSFA